MSSNQDLKNINALSVLLTRRRNPTIPCHVTYSADIVSLQFFRCSAAGLQHEAKANTKFFSFRRVKLLNLGY